MFIFYKLRKFLTIHITTLQLPYKQIYQVYMCAIMLIKIKFIETTSSKKIIRCFQIKKLYFNQYIFFINKFF